MPRHLVSIALASLFAFAPAARAQPPAGAAPLASDLRYLREEEKLARDVYRVLGQRWDLPIFENIESAEERHMARVGMLLTQRGIADPVTDDATGAFQDPSLRALFVRLTQRGSGSLVAALRVGAEIEELDIHDLEEKRARTSDPEVIRTYDLLACGSGNHLRAFMRQLRARGADYAPSHLSEERFRAILAAPQEPCGRRFGGGPGRGFGRRGR